MLIFLKVFSYLRKMKPWSLPFDSICLYKYCLWKISSNHCFIQTRHLLPKLFQGSELFPSGSRAMSSLSNWDLPHAFNKKVGKDSGFTSGAILILLCSYFRHDLSVFFQSPEVEWHVTQVYKMMMYLFLELAVNFILLVNKPTFSHCGVSRECYFHPLSFNLDILA